MKNNALTINAKNAGIGLRSQHYDDILTLQPDLGFLEVHIENYFPKGGKTARALREAAEKYPISFHGVSMSLGSASEPDKEHLLRVKELMDKFNPALISEHLSWSSIDEKYIGDLLPVPYTEEALNIFCRNVDIVQNTLGRQILIENPSAYLLYEHNEISEWDFMSELVNRTNCGMLLDLNNIFVSTQNLGTDTSSHMNKMPLHAVKEIHLAGHTIKNYNGDDYKSSDPRAAAASHNKRTIRIDTHSDVVCNDVWKMYEQLIHKTGAVPTLVEWDMDIPELNILVDEAYKATSIMKKVMKAKANAA